MEKESEVEREGGRGRVRERKGGMRGRGGGDIEDRRDIRNMIDLGFDQINRLFLVFPFLDSHRD